MLNNKESLKKYLIGFALEYKLFIFLSALVAILGSIFEISVDYKIKEIIDSIASNKDSEISYLLIMFVAYKLMDHAFFFIGRVLYMIYNPKIIQKTVLDLYEKTVLHSLQWFTSNHSGSISSKISDFEDGITNLISGLFVSFHIFCAIVISVIFLLRVNLYTSAVLFVFILVYAPIIAFLLKKKIALQGTYVTSKQKAMGVINDSISNMLGIKTIGNINSEIKSKLKPSIKTWKYNKFKVAKFDAFFLDNADTVMVVTMSAVQIYLLAYLYKSGHITAGGFAFVAMMTLKIHTYIDWFIENIMFDITPSIAKIKSSYEFVNEKIDVLDPENPKEIIDYKGEIHYKNVCYSYLGEGKILSNFTLKIKEGERIGIVGASGSGKTTITKCLLRYFDVDSGSISIDGVDIRHMSQEYLRSKISIIPQDISMFHRSIIDNIRVAKYDATYEEIIDSCKRAKIHDDIMKMNNGYETIVGEKGAKISGGQRQRIAIARAVLKNSKILILDEATSSLDTLTENLIQESINEMLESNKSTVIAIAHRLSTIKHMDRIIVLDKGKIIEEGTHESLILNENGHYKKLWDMQEI